MPCPEIRKIPLSTIQTALQTQDFNAQELSDSQLLLKSIDRDFDGSISVCEFDDAFLSRAQEAPQVELKEKTKYSGKLCSPFQNFEDHLGTSHIRLPAERRAKALYQNKMFTAWQVMGNELKKQLGVADNVVIGDFLCEAKRIEPPPRQQAMPVTPVQQSWSDQPVMEYEDFEETGLEDLIDDSEIFALLSELETTISDFSRATMKWRTAEIIWQGRFCEIQRVASRDPAHYQENQAWYDQYLDSYSKKYEDGFFASAEDYESVVALWDKLDRQLEQATLTEEEELLVFEKTNYLGPRFSLAEEKYQELQDGYDPSGNGQTSCPDAAPSSDDLDLFFQ